MATIAVIGVGDLTGSVNSLCFSRADSGSMLVAIDDSSDKIISVWEWQRGEKGHKITETRVSRRNVSSNINRNFSNYLFLITFTNFTLSTLTLIICFFQIIISVFC